MFPCTVPCQSIRFGGDSSLVRDCTESQPSPTARTGQLQPAKHTERTRLLRGDEDDAVYMGPGRVNVFSADECLAPLHYFCAEALLCACLSAPEYCRSVVSALTSLLLLQRIELSKLFTSTRLVFIAAFACSLAMFTLSAFFRGAT